VSEILRRSAEHTKWLLGRELEIRLGELNEAWHAASLERIFIENKLYQLIEGSKSREEAYAAVDKGLEPFKKLLRREVTLSDVQRLTELKFIRISRYDSDKADNEIRQIEEDIKSTQYDLNHLTEYAVAYYERIRDKYGKGRERRTELREFDNIEEDADIIDALLEEGLVADLGDDVAAVLGEDDHVVDVRAVADQLGVLHRLADAEEAFGAVHVELGVGHGDLRGFDIVEFAQFGPALPALAVLVADTLVIGHGIFSPRTAATSSPRSATRPSSRRASIISASSSATTSGTIYNVLYRDGKNGPIMMKRCAIKGHHARQGVRHHQGHAQERDPLYVCQSER